MWTGMPWKAWNRTGVFTRAASLEFLILKTGMMSMTPACERWGIIKAVELAELGSELQGLEELEGELSWLQGMVIELQGLGEELEGELSQDKKTQELKMTNCRTWKNLKENRLETRRIILGQEPLDSDEVMQGMDGRDCFRAWVVSSELWFLEELEGELSRDKKT
jgi:hypothetical protein